MGQWLERQLNRFLDDEVELSEEAQRRLDRPYQGEVPVPTGVVLKGWSEGEYRVLEHEPPANGVIMKESDIDRMTAVDARFIGPNGNRYDTPFRELCDPRVRARQDRIRSYNRRISTVGAAMVGAVALGAAWLAFHLPSSNAEKRSCDSVISDGNQIVMPFEKVKPRIRQHAVRTGETCKLGEHEYVLLKSQKAAISDGQPARAPHPSRSKQQKLKK